MNTQKASAQAVAQFFWGLSNSAKSSWKVPLSAQKTQSQAVAQFFSVTFQLAGGWGVASKVGTRYTSREQFRQAYPQAAEFFAKKRHYDPDEVFRNQFYVKYGLP